MANFMVRLNSSELFISCYPVEDQELSREQRDNSLEMQHTTMMNLMRDTNPTVRCAAISGVRSFSLLLAVGAQRHHQPGGQHAHQGERVG